MCALFLISKILIIGFFCIALLFLILLAIFGNISCQKISSCTNRTKNGKFEKIICAENKKIIFREDGTVIQIYGECHCNEE